MRKYVLVAVLLLCAVYGKAQDSANYLNDFIYTVQWSSNGINAQGDTIAILSCNLNIPDTNSISAISVKVGSFKGDNSLVDHLFPTDAAFGHPNGYSYLQTGNSITLQLGSQTPAMYYFKIELFDNNGNKSDPLFYNPFTNKLSTN